MHAILLHVYTFVFSFLHINHVKETHNLCVFIGAFLYTHTHTVSDAYTVYEYYLYTYTYLNNLSMLGYSMLGMLLVKLNLENKLSNPQCHRVAGLLVRDPGSE